MQGRGSPGSTDAATGTFLPSAQPAATEWHLGSGVFSSSSLKFNERHCQKTLNRKEKHEVVMEGKKHSRVECGARLGLAPLGPGRANPFNWTDACNLVRRGKRVRAGDDQATWRVRVAPPGPQRWFSFQHLHFRITSTSENWTQSGGRGDFPWS